MNHLGVKLALIRPKFRRVETLKPEGLTAARKPFIPHIGFPLVQKRCRTSFVSRIKTSRNSSKISWDQHPIIVRDACACSMCVDPHSGQKNFKTTDIPLNIEVGNMELHEDSLIVKWINDIPGFQSHKSIIPLKSLRATPDDSCNHLQDTTPSTWDARTMQQVMPSIRFDFTQYTSGSKTFHEAIRSIKRWGIVFLTGVPECEEAVEKIARLIGPLRNTFYGKTWDVVSMKQAKNVAYTDKYLGLHQDLLYMETPPGLQLLHCLKNDCVGGESLFCDAFKVAGQLSASDYDILSKEKIHYHYEKAGESYQHSHLVLEANPEDQKKTDGVRMPSVVNYSPPFQAPFALNFHHSSFKNFVRSLGRFAQEVESPKNVIKYKLMSGECVIFNNRRILHGRESFELQAGKKRWLKGCYLDSDVFLSRSRLVH
ncbi:Gamma-butyrobetaine dioxygenase [Erysiphe neolycopersici]|uniref:Gamma-butyrobetaine dioxygenase n=1 Tax=Erysiphe neolycopersici TaxID=212602 RepID=A0A420HZZ4_9PEZI|nr:Gamma-butyrobetaine dioxygenase [Erysiphe neolycopersici]